LRPKYIDLYIAIDLHVRALIRSSVLVGSGGGISAEARQFHFERIREGARRGGVSSGEKRRANREKRWESSALEIAKKYRKSNPGASQDDVATEIAAAWKAETKVPGHVTLKHFVSRMEHAGDLAKRQT
jgi:hypothetical protein